MDESAEIAATAHPHIPDRTRVYGIENAGVPTHQNLDDSKVSAVALEAAIADWGDTVLRLAASRLGNLTDAEDVFQTVFLKLFQSDLRFRDGSHLKAWLLRVTVNCCNDAHRSAWRKHRANLDDAVIATLATPKEHDSKGCDEELTCALAQLGERQRTVVHLFYFEGYSTDEIAHITGERPATVRSHLHRARKTLRNKLGAHL